MKWEHQIRSAEMSVQSDHLLTLLSKAKQCRLLRDDCYISSQLVTSCITHRNDTRADLQPREESLLDRPSSMACLNYATFLVLLCLMKGAIAGSVTTGNTCTITTDCADTNEVCVPTVLKCLIMPTKACSTTDNKCVTGATCSGTSPTCSCDTTKHIAATPDYCRLKLDQSCSASTAPCLNNGECASSTCKCKTGYVASTDKTACAIQPDSYGASCTPGGATDTCTTYDTNSECPTGQTTCKCKATFYGVIGSKCGLAVDAACTSTSVCLPNAECSGTSCKCKTGYTANAAKTECAVTADTYGGACTVTSSTDSCVATDSNAVCNTLTNKCECKQGFTGSIGAKCSGAMGLASSLFLVIASLFIVTRLH